ncbi:MAG: leucine-rich repeat domain-containing protein [Eubacteriales bacterium]
MKKLSFLLAFVFILSTLFLCSCEINGNYVYELNESGDGYVVWAIFRNPIIALTADVIPNEHNGLPVTEIKDGAFSGWSGIYELNIPSNIRKIGNYAFGSCQNLALVQMAEGVETVDAYAFANCTTLTEVSLPSTLEYIGNGAFGLCNNLDTIKYNGTVEEWHEIEKDDGWYEGSAISGYIAVACSDGNVIVQTN